MRLGDRVMKVAIKVKDMVSLVRQFEAAPAATMQDMVEQMRHALAATLERVMNAEIELYLGDRAGNKRNGYVSRTFAVKGIGALRVKVPRDREGTYSSAVIPARRRYDEGLEKDIALLHLAGLSTRMLSLVSKKVLGMNVSAQEVSNALQTIVPAARAFLTRPLEGRRFVYLYIDGTNFHVRRTTVALEPTLVIIGVDDQGCKSVISAVQGDKDSKLAWEMVFDDVKKRGLEVSAVALGIMDGLPGLGDAFKEAFPRARVARCWVHKARNVLPRVPKRYQAAFKTSFDAVQYAESKAAAEQAFVALRQQWEGICKDAVMCLHKDLPELLVHYDFTQEHWNALRTTNPIERVNKEFKRRSGAMEVMSPDGLYALLAFVALRLEYGWATTPITSNKLKNLSLSATRQIHFEQATAALLH